MGINDYYDPRYDQGYEQCDVCDVMSDKETICDLELKKNEVNYDVEIFSALKSKRYQKPESNEDMIFFSDL